MHEQSRFPYSREQQSAPDCVKWPPGNKNMERIYDLLFKMGITSKNRGYIYLAAAAEQLLRTPAKEYQFTKVLYPDLAKEFGVTPARIEQNIRFTITAAWETRRKQMEQVMGTEFPKRPTNRKFLELFVVRVQQYDKLYGQHARF